MGFVRKLQLSSFQRTPLSFCTMFEARTIGSRMQCGIFQPDCKNLQKKFYEVGSQVQDFNFTQFWTPWVGTIWIRLNWLGSFTLGLQPPAAPCEQTLNLHPHHPVPTGHSGIFDEKLSHAQKIKCSRALKKVEIFFQPNLTKLGYPLGIY